MEKAIKKEIERNLRQPSAEFEKIIKQYKRDIAGTEKDIILRFFYERNYKYYATIREMNRHRFYLDTATFYRLKTDILVDIALRACYKRLICPMCDKTKP